MKLFFERGIISDDNKQLLRGFGATLAAPLACYLVSCFNSASAGKRSRAAVVSAIVCGRGLKDELYMLQHEKEASNTEVIRSTSTTTSTVAAMAFHKKSSEDQDDDGTKEQDTNWLRMSPMEAKFLFMKLEFLQAENRRMKMAASQNLGAMRELQSARLKIKHLKRMLRSSRVQARRKMASLGHKVALLQDKVHEDEQIEAAIRQKLRKFEDLQDEAAALRKANSSLKQENLDLAQRLEAAQVPLSVLEHSQDEAFEEINHLRESNDQLQKKIEQLESDCNAEEEELRYLRWLTINLSNELSSKHPPPPADSKSILRRRLSPIPDELDSEHRSSSQGSDHEFTVLNTATTPRNTSPKNNSRKPKFLRKFKKLVSRKISKDSINSDRRASSASTSSDIESNASCLTDDHSAMTSPVTGSESDANEKWRHNSAWIQGAFQTHYVAPRSRRFTEFLY
ncbi:protein CHUP1, chloroplastic-like [Canna indica]|uniref:Protein CHUP1, chloroplastic-like n=1 Tax=Canna indica TaxID=4628 RepID=A0AAQ3JYJ1_9LILI|nr:protein CHUP1, chloroplastic-like [Canna indica]